MDEMKNPLDWSSARVWREDGRHGRCGEVAALL